MKNRVHVHFIGWDAKWDRIMDISRNQDCFAKPGRYSSVREKSEFKVSDDVLIMRRKPPEARGKWIQGYVRMVDGPQLQVQYTYRGITFQYWYHYQQPEVHPMKDKNRWLGLKPSERMQDLPDGESGLFGKEIVYLLFSRKAPSLKRVGAHADGTCFFHAVFHSLDTKDPRDGKGLSYRNLSSEERAEKGCEWRQALSRQVDRKWFAENLGNVCEYKSYLEQYSTATYSVGPTHNMHVAARFQVNIFFVSFYTNPDTKERVTESCDKESYVTLRFRTSSFESHPLMEPRNTIKKNPASYFSTGHMAREVITSQCRRMRRVVSSAEGYSNTVIRSYSTC
mmetsp:Transcript_9918/g.19554  ORF Transcript_9918/g.19554 Transcript_9918/m.19554 type:complete len:338 (-) Transcript_9918:272-1285(-)